MNTNSATPSGQRDMFAFIRGRFVKRHDSEHSQAIIRIIIACVLLAYIFYFNAEEDFVARHTVSSVVAFSFLSAIGLFVSIIIWPQPSRLRRLMGMALDFSTLAYLMYTMEEKGISIFSLFLWVTIGNGLRYGKHYLHAAMAMSIVSFVVVINFSDYWKAQWSFNTGLLIGMVVLPLYFSNLLRRLNEQNNELKKLYEQMTRHAIYDSLTNLPNRKHFDDHLAEAILAAKRDKKSFAILYLDLDGFKNINDALGHGVGDKIIEHTARRLEQCIRKGDFVARVGGDEFTILLRDITAHDVTKVAEKTIEALSRPFTIDANDLRITTSIGVATYPDNGTDASTLIQNADGAMYEAKRSGKNRYRVRDGNLIQQAG